MSSPMNTHIFSALERSCDEARLEVNGRSPSQEPQQLHKPLIARPLGALVSHHYYVESLGNIVDIAGGTRLVLPGDQGSENMRIHGRGHHHGRF